MESLHCMRWKENCRQGSGGELAGKKRIRVDLELEAEELLYAVEEFLCTSMEMLRWTRSRGR
uniref:Uncharacterized protein n=1 Tax=Setaria italica TaxID=4555 RepID=K4ANR5_SETIT